MNFLCPLEKMTLALRSSVFLIPLTPESCVCFITRFVIAARAGEADTWHHRVLLQAAGGGGSSSAAYSPLHRRNVCQGADGGSKTVSTAEGLVKKNLDFIQNSQKVARFSPNVQQGTKKVTCS